MSRVIASFALMFGAILTTWVTLWKGWGLTVESWPWVIWMAVVHFVLLTLNLSILEEKS